MHTPAPSLALHARSVTHCGSRATEAAAISASVGEHPSGKQREFVRSQLQISLAQTPPVVAAHCVLLLAFKQRPCERSTTLCPICSTTATFEHGSMHIHESQAMMKAMLECNARIPVLLQAYRPKKPLNFLSFFLCEGSGVSTHALLGKSLQISGENWRAQRLEFN